MSLTETITWTPVSEGLPDADITLQVALEDDNEPTWLGYYDGESWKSVEGFPFAGRVTHYSTTLAGPKKAST